MPRLNLPQMLILVAVTAALALALAWAIEERRIRSFMERLSTEGVGAFEPMHEQTEQPEEEQ